MPARQHGAFAERLRANADLANTLALNARARYLGIVNNTTDCAQALDFARTHERQHELPLLLLGAGSNVVLPPYFPGLALSVAQRDWQIVAEQGDSVWVECAGGANWHRFVLWCSANNCFGLENLAFIPGSVGAAPVQNIGAYGVELSEFVDQVCGYDFSRATEFAYSASECQFAYRTSAFKSQEQLLILRLRLRLSKRFAPKLSYQGLAENYLGARDLLAAIGRLRWAKLPSIQRQPNVGSFFCNPVVTTNQHLELQRRLPQLQAYPLADGNYKLSAAQLLQLAGCKGQGNLAGTVAMSSKHALVLTNTGGASYQQLLDFARQVQKQVYDLFAVELQIEPKVLIER